MQNIRLQLDQLIRFHFMYAPVLLFVYNRLDKLTLTVRALQLNYLAARSELFIFSDGPKKTSDVSHVDQVRDFVKTIRGFEKIHISESKEHKGLANSIIEGVTTLIQIHNKVIVLEDDLITSPNFLSYLNQSLDFYAADQRVFSVTGYTIPGFLHCIAAYDGFFLPRACSWGWGTWKDRWESVDWEVSSFRDLRKSKSSIRSFNMGGSDMYSLLKRQMRGEIDSWAIRWCYQRFLNDAVTHYPFVSKVENIGFDSAATHTRGFNRFRSELDPGGVRLFSFDPEVKTDSSLVARIQVFYSIRSRAMSKFNLLLTRLSFFKKKNEKNSILFILHLPGAMHGVSLIGQYIKNDSIVNEQYDANYINLATSDSIKGIGKLNVKKAALVLKMLWQIFSLLLKKKPDLVYVSLSVNPPAFFKDLAVVTLLKLFNKSILYHLHNKGRNPRYHKLYKYTFRNTKAILLSPLLYPDIEQYLKPEDVYYCANGIPDNAVMENEVRRIPNQVCSLLFLSNIMTEKGIWELLEACRLLSLRGVLFECHVVGGWADVTEKEFSEKIYEYKLAEKVIVHGPKFGDEKDDFFKAADIFVFPTFYSEETFGIVNIEAMKFGLPVISTYEGAIPDVVIDGKTGFLTRQQDTSQLAKKIELLITDPALRKQMGEAGRERFKENFTIEKFQDRLSDIFSEVIKNRKSGSSRFSSQPTDRK